MTRASFSPAIGWRGTHSRATHQRARQHRSSVRFDWTHCRPLGAFACGAVSIALLANACQSFTTSDDLSMTLFGVSSLPFGALCGWFLAPANPRREVDEAAELEARQRWWSEAADEMLELKRQYAEAQKNHQSCEHIWLRMRELNAKMLCGGEVR